MAIEIPFQAYIALGAVFAALIAGFFSFLNLIISKESKVSEFRQDWIDSLRSEIGEYAASVNALATLNNPKQPQLLDAEYRRASLTVVDQQDQSYTSITLRINRDEDNQEHKSINNNFLDALENIRQAYKNGQFEQARKLLVPLRDSAKPLLKYEWERVKKGENVYRISKYSALIVLVIGMLGTVYVFHHFTSGA